MKCALLFIAAWLPHVPHRTHAQELQPQVLSAGNSGSLLNSQRLTIAGDIASQLVDGVDSFLLKKLERAVAERQAHWQPDFSTNANYHRSLEAQRRRLSQILGVVEDRVPVSELEQQRPLTECNSESLDVGYRVFSVRWPVLEDPDPKRTIVSVYADGLLFIPHSTTPIVADVVVVPDCDSSLRDFCGLNQAPDGRLAIARQLAERNCRVLVPLLINREPRPQVSRSVVTNREFIYRPSFVLGRHLIGYEVQRVLAGIDWLRGTALPPSTPAASVGQVAGGLRPLGLIGCGEGGRIGLAAAALDDRIDALCVSAAFGSYETIWQEPIDRNVFGLLEQFGAAEQLSMVAPRSVLIDHWAGPTKPVAQPAGGTPSVLEPISVAAGNAEVARARELVKPLVADARWRIEESSQGNQREQLQNWDAATIDLYLSILCGRTIDSVVDFAVSLEPSAFDLDEAAMQLHTVEELDRHNQLLLRESPFVRDQFMKELKTDSLANYAASIESYRRVFRDEVIGRFEDELLPLNARTRQTWDTEKWTGHEVVLDVFPEVIAYGVLLLPKNLREDERRPVVVCQHGLEGRPTDTFLDDHAAYHNFAARLADEGFIVFAPQNLYLFQDRFRTLQRKANPLGKTLFSVIVPQHQQIVNWLKSLPQVDPARIGFYGLSYGGKSAMRIPALVTDYCLSICSADFNEWVVKNSSTRDDFSYVWTSEYEIFEWNLGSTFNYAEMAALICPRPFMVERGHFDGVGKDPWVAFEYAKVRHLYAAQLKIGERTQIEWFDGPHTIHGQGTFEFLRQHLDFNH